MKLYFIVGEDSGDLHTQNLVRALRELHPELQSRGVGGDKMASVGTELVAHIKEVNFMGFLEVVKNLGTIRKLFRTVKADILDWKPDAVILVDYPGFNLRMAKFLQRRGIRVFYYISPQVWAWKKGRVKSIRKYVERMFVILPFEKEFYAREGVEVDFVGHPLLDAIGPVDHSKRVDKMVLLMPGSRKQEIKRMLPVMLAVARRYPEYRFVIAGAPSQAKEFYSELIADSQVELIMHRTYELLREASSALVTSGTATLETGLFAVPQVVCYRGNSLSFEIGKRLVRVDFISLVNLILGRLVVQELIQYDFTEEKLAAEFAALTDPATREQMLSDYEELRQKLGDSGASMRTARLLSQRLLAENDGDSDS